MKRSDRLVGVVAVVFVASVVALAVSSYSLVAKDSPAAVTAAEIAGVATKESELPTVEGLGSILEGWTFTNDWGVDDWRVDTILQAHGAKEADYGEIPDVRLDTTYKAGEPVLWVRYRGQDRFVRKSDPEFHSRVTKIMIDMARVRLAELREEISRKEGN